ncbi:MULTISPECIES: hypothetical protein [unclassified Streptomyces]|uniref:HflX-like GTP-binding protein n=1 Tax=unclassified Streptomyces TaxID=2593676 RepID=UPI002035E3E0|nr:MULTISPECIES: hypothetical protein [unclassified Streptomyces]
MYQDRRRERRPRRRARAAVPRRPVAPFSAEGDGVVVVGYFSAKQRDFAALMDAAVADLAAEGIRVLGRLVQRRGVSDGGARKMDMPYSSRTLISHGKVRLVAAVCEETGADAVVFLAPLTERQRRLLTQALGCPAISLQDARPSANFSPSVHEKFPTDQ